MNKKYDEKQLLIERGKSFQCSFWAAIVTNIIIYILSTFVGVGFESGTILLVNLGVLISLYVISMIIRKAYDGTKKSSERLNISALGGCGVALLIIYIPNVVSGKESLYQNSVITENAGALFAGILMIFIFALYWINKYIENKKHS